ncbi:MAG: galactokinase [Clostridiales bacterium]|nr:galactokinase [Clostridiales bacterium]
MGLIKDIKNTQNLKKIYGENAKFQLDRYEKIQNKFIELFGQEPSGFFSTSGRSEIIGNHTDHNHGCVMAAGINLDAVAAVIKTDDNNVYFASEGYKDMNIIDLDDLTLNTKERGTTTSLIRGIAYHMKEDLGYNIGGFKAYVQSDVFRGSGLSSSAAIEVLIYTIFNFLYNDGKLDNVEGAKTSQWAENNYFGKPCGLMDQTACALGKLVFIDFADPTNPIIEGIDFDFNKEGYSIIITDVHADHADLTQEYAAITEEMKAVAKYFGKEYLRDVNENVFYSSLMNLRECVSDRAVMRAIHFFDENKRVLQAVEAIKNKNLKQFFNAISDSGESSWKLLQNTHATGSCQQAMTLALALSQKLLDGEGACRVHGGGFGGTILAFVPKKIQNYYISEMEKIFGKGACNELSVRPIGTSDVEIQG